MDLAFFIRVVSVLRHRIDQAIYLEGFLKFLLGLLFTFYCFFLLFSRGISESISDAEC